MWVCERCGKARGVVFTCDGCHRQVCMDCIVFREMKQLCLDCAFGRDAVGVDKPEPSRVGK